MALHHKRCSFPLLFILSLSICSLVLCGTCEAKSSKASGQKEVQETTKNKQMSSHDIWLKRARENADIVLGKASWYGGDFHTGPTASGVPYNMYTFTAAHRSLPFGTIVRVTDQYSGKSVMVCVTDRGPFVKGRIIDMSYAAANRIGLSRKGISTVGLEVVSDSKGRPLNDREAFFVEMKSPTGPERFGPYDTFDDAAAVHEALLLAHPEASVVLGAR